MIKINFLQLLSMSNVDIEKTFRNKLVYLNLKMAVTLKEL